MTREAEIRASEQMRDRIADMLHDEAISRDRRTPEQLRLGHRLGPRPALLYFMEKQVRRLPGRLAQGEAADEKA